MRNTFRSWAAQFPALDVMVVEDCNCESVETSVLEELLDANPSLLPIRAERVAKVTRFLRSEENKSQGRHSLNQRFDRRLDPACNHCALRLSNAMNDSAGQP
jgi:hypothetical protein